MGTIRVLKWLLDWAARTLARRITLVPGIVQFKFCSDCLGFEVCYSKRFGLPCRCGERKPVDESQACRR